MKLRTFQLVLITAITSSLAFAADPPYTVPSGVERLPMPPDLMPAAPQLSAPTNMGERIDFPSIAPEPSPPAASPLASSLAAPSEPLEVQPMVPTYWSRPWTWIPWDGWKNSFELGLNGTEGNAQSTSFQTAVRLRRQSEAHSYGMDLTHNRTRADSVDTQNNSFFGNDYDYKLGKTAWTVFFKQGLEYDKFKAFDSRLNLNSGLGYYWINDDLTNLITRFGAGTSREFGGIDKEWKPEAVLAVETNHQINQRNKVYGKIEYFPQWDDFNAYRMVNDVGWEILVDESNNLSFKIAATNRYDSTPLGRKPSDLNYSALLLYKF